MFYHMVVDISVFDDSPVVDVPSNASAMSSMMVESHPMDDVEDDIVEVS